MRGIIERDALVVEPVAGVLRDCEPGQCMLAACRLRD